MGSDNGLLPGGTKPLLYPALTHHHWGPLAFTWGQFQSISSRYLSLIWVWKLLLKLQPHLPGVSKVTRYMIQVHCILVILQAGFQQSYVSVLRNVMKLSIHVYVEICSRVLTHGKVNDTWNSFNALNQILHFQLSLFCAYRKPKMCKLSGSFVIFYIYIIHNRANVFLHRLLIGHLQSQCLCEKLKTWNFTYVFNIRR